MLLLIITIPSSLASSTSFGDAADDDAFNDILNRLMQSFQPRGPPPASKSFVETLPKISVDSELQKEANRCPVCLLDYELEEEVLKLPCKHIFHEECITTWLKQANTCCVCRHELPKQEDETPEPSQSTSETSTLNNPSHNDESLLSSSVADHPSIFDEDWHNVDEDLEANHDDNDLPELISEEELEEIDIEIDTEFLDTGVARAASLTSEPASSPPPNSIQVEDTTPRRSPLRVVDDDLPPQEHSTGIANWFSSRFSCFRRAFSSN